MCRCEFSRCIKVVLPDPEGGVKDGWLVSCRVGWRDVLGLGGELTGHADAYDGYGRRRHAGG